MGRDGQPYDTEPTAAQIADGTDPAGRPLGGQLELGPTEIRTRPSRGSVKNVSKRIRHPVGEAAIGVDTLVSAEVGPRRWSARLVIEDKFGRRFRVTVMCPPELVRTSLREVGVPPRALADF